jgi:hypothetical protein
MSSEDALEIPLETAEIILLEWLSTSGGQTLTLIEAHKRFAEWFRQQYPQAPVPPTQEVLWSLIRKGWAYPFRDPQVINNILYIRLTEAGKTVAQEGEFNPYHIHDYLTRLETAIPGLSNVVRQYVYESLMSFTNGCYLSSAVMLGVASEAAFLDMCEAFSEWLSGAEGRAFRSKFGATWEYNKRFRLFLDTVERHCPTEKGVEPKIDSALYQNMDVWLNGILNIIRMYRNNAGHPTEQHITRAEMRDLLILFSSFARRMYVFSWWFREQLRQRRLAAAAAVGR